MKPQRRSLFPPFAGVALADILANSVAIVIIMIVVTLLTRYEQEQDKVEQAEDVAVLLSRELASSFVMNALPTSPPARLHDYVSSPLDRHPQHSRMPVLELHDDYVRDYYTGTTYSRDELLRGNNALDAYLDTLTPEQLAALRVDVYGIRQFYVAMSILKAHGQQPRHWHFLAPPGESVAGSGGARVALAPRPRRGADVTFGAGDGAGAAGHTVPSAALPRDVAPTFASGGFGGYPDDPRAFTESGAGGVPPEYLGLPGGPAADGVAQSSATPTPAAGATAVRSFRAANSAALGDLASELRVDLYTILRALFAYMREVQAAADAQRPSVLPYYDFQRDVLGLVAELDEPTAAEERLLRALVFVLEAPRAPADAALALQHQTTSEVRGQALAVFANEPLRRALWLADAAQPASALPAASALVALRLGAHAEVFRGLRVPLARDSVLLAPAEVADPRPRWRVVTLVNAARSDFLTGFVYAAQDAVGRLVLPVDENAVDVDGLRVESRLPSVAFRGEWRQMLFYGVVAVLFAAGLVRRYWSASTA